jgi:hypothetical protein
MMRSIKTGEGQTVLDIAMQYCGDTGKSLEICLLNNISITEDLVPGTVLKMPDVVIDKEKIVREFADRLIVPASKDEEEEQTVQGGIGFMAIEDDFIIT